MEGFSISHTHAIRLILLALEREEFGLVGDLLRFIMPPSEWATYCASSCPLVSAEAHRGGEG